MLYTITKEFHFSASHQLSHLPDTHPCSRLHGHNYIVKVELEADELNKNGFVVDYGDLADLKEFIDDVLDHRHLNDAFTFPTTAENIARFLFKYCRTLWPQTISVSVSETPKTWATYRELRLKA